MTNTVYDTVAGLYDRIEALEAQNADLLAAAEVHDNTVVGGEREKPKMTDDQNIVVIGSGHLLSILAENDLLRAENTRLRATIERSLKPAPVGTCPAGGEHDWPTGAESYTGVCLKCGRGR